MSLTVIGIICFLGFIAIAPVVVKLRAFYQRGFQDGYTAGRKDADNWWIGVETEADKERQKIWREGIQR